jgi:hypothetical protein
MLILLRNTGNCRGEEIHESAAIDPWQYVLSIPSLTLPLTDLARTIVHGYSLLRTQLNTDYFNELFDVSADFGVDIEGHRNPFSHLPA